MEQHVCAAQLAATRMPQVSCQSWRDACRKLSTWAQNPCIHVLGCPVAPDNARNNLPLPQDQAVSDTRPRAGGLNYSIFWVGGRGPANNIKRRFNMQMGISSGWARAPPRQQHPSRACHCKTFMQQSRFIAKFAMHSSAGQKHGTKLATMGHCHTSDSM